MLPPQAAKGQEAAQATVPKVLLHPLFFCINRTKAALTHGLSCSHFVSRGGKNQQSILTTTDFQTYAVEFNPKESCLSVT